LPNLISCSGGEAVDLVEVTGRIGMQHDAAEREELSGDKDIPAADPIIDEKVSH
jgi:hypothetical protein